MPLFVFDEISSVHEMQPVESTSHMRFIDAEAGGQLQKTLTLASSSACLCCLRLLASLQLVAVYGVVAAASNGSAAAP